MQGVMYRIQGNRVRIRMPPPPPAAHHPRSRQLCRQVGWIEGPTRPPGDFLSARHSADLQNECGRIQGQPSSQEPPPTSYMASDLS